jgi:hypothetical protein
VFQSLPLREREREKERKRERERDCERERERERKREREVSLKIKKGLKGGKHNALPGNTVRPEAVLPGRACPAKGGELLAFSIVLF